MIASKVDEQGSQGAAAISNAMTKLLREHYGRGPNSVRSVVGHDHVICFLEDIYTPAERTLLESGEVEVVVEMRLAFQRAMEARFTELIESVTGRRVRAFLSQTHIDPDISCEIFVLEPNGSRPAPEGIG